MATDAAQRYHCRHSTLMSAKKKVSTRRSYKERDTLSVITLPNLHCQGSVHGSANNTSKLNEHTTEENTAKQELPKGI